MSYEADLYEARAEASRTAREFAEYDIAVSEREYEQEAERERALCDVDSAANWLNGECMDEQTYAVGPSAAYCAAAADAAALAEDYDNAKSISTPKLFALALGMTECPKARLAALDELRDRYLKEVMA